MIRFTTALVALIAMFCTLALVPATAGIVGLRSNRPQGRHPSLLVRSSAR